MASDSLRAAPYLQAAFLCERVLQEMDSVPSFIRVVDRFARTRPGATGQTQQPISVMLIVSFKGGDVPTGSYKIKIRALKPGEIPFMEVENDVFFQGVPDVGVTIGTPILFIPEEEGLYWIDVLFMEQQVTRVPFRVIFAGAPSIQMSPQAGF